LRLAQLTQDCGLDGVVCSAREVSALRQALGQEFLLVTPGIRPAQAERGDQARVATPHDAIQNGSSYLVIGRRSPRPPILWQPWRLCGVRLARYKAGDLLRQGSMKSKMETVRVLVVGDVDAGSLLVRRGQPHFARSAGAGGARQPQRRATRRRGQRGAQYCRSECAKPPCCR